MKQRTLGKNGLTVSAIGIGCMTIGKDYSEESKKQAIAILRKAYDLGYTMFDTAEIYGGNYRNEELVGEALKPFRKDVAVATKCGITFSSEGRMTMDSSGENIRKSLEGSLKRLQTDYVDLYYMMMAYWGYVLLCIHAGTHLAAPLRKLYMKNKKIFAAVCAVSSCISVYGCAAFIKRGFPGYMLGSTMFAFFDYSEPRTFFFLDYMAIMVLFMMTGCLAVYGLSNHHKSIP